MIAYMSHLYLFSKVSPLLWAFAYSVAVSNLFKYPFRELPGVGYAAGTLLRFSIAVMGFTVSAVAWITVGWAGLLTVLGVILFALVLGTWFSKRLGLRSATGALIAGGTAICGATAIAALGPAVDAREEEMGVAVSCITLFGLLAMVLYPFLFQATPLGALLRNSPTAFGIWAGTGIHETAQVIGAAAQVGEEALRVAIVAKSVRIFSIVPVVVLFSLLFAGRVERGSRSRTVPFFALFFVAASLVNSGLLLLPSTAQAWQAFSGTWVKPFLTLTLAVSFAGLGFKVHLRSLTSIGWRAFVAGLVTASLTAVAALLLVVFFYLPASGL